MYRTTLGHARLTQHPTVVMRPLDFEDRSRVFKFWFTWGQFRDRMFLGRSEHDRDSVLAQNAYPKRPSTPAGRKARSPVGWASCARVAATGAAVRPGH